MNEPACRLFTKIGILMSVDDESVPEIIDWTLHAVGDIRVETNECQKTSELALVFCRYGLWQAFILGVSSDDRGKWIARYCFDDIHGVYLSWC